jgi:GMP synthase-like glutamine amidotransferase
MKTLCVLQHTEAEFLGLIEDHLEARGIRFRYVRPFMPGGTVPRTAKGFDGLVALGAGPFGIVSGHLVPSLGPELRLARDFLERGLPVVGIGFGACLLASASGGGAEEAPLRFTAGSAVRTAPLALEGHLPETYPLIIYMRDRPVLPAAAEVLAVDTDSAPALFQLRDNCLGFLGHPGIKSAMIEDLIMAFEEVPVGTAETLARLRAAQGEIAAALSRMMVGMTKVTHLMAPNNISA